METKQNIQDLKVKENNLLILPIDWNLGQILEIIDRVLQKSLLSLYIEFTGLPTQNSFYYFELQQIITKFVSQIKIKNILFDFNIIFPQIFKLESLETTYQNRILKPLFKFDQIIKLTTQNEINLEISEKINLFQKNVQERVQNLECLKNNQNTDKNKNIPILSKQRVALGGTFDYLHNGHKLLISQALLIGKDIVIGITSDIMLKNKKLKEIIQSINKRIKDLEQFISIYSGYTKNNLQTFLLEELQDPVGPAGRDHLDILVISPESIKGGDYVNNFRKEKGLNECEFLIIDIISEKENEQKETEVQDKTSSSTIRNVLNTSSLGKIEYLRQKWNQCAGESQISDLWFWNLVNLYSENQRFYHNLSHIVNLFEQSDQIQDRIQDKIVVSLSIWFHDSIYNPRESDNEERSAELLKQFYSEINQNQIISEDQYKKIYQYIIDTKNHTKIESEDNDLNQFLDMDLSILGQDRDTYMTYSKQILQEYSHYEPHALYKGRTQVLQTFIQQENLFKTQFFNDKYNNQAKQNLKNEIEYLQQLSKQQQQE